MARSNASIRCSGRSRDGIGLERCHQGFGGVEQPGGFERGAPQHVDSEAVRAAEERDLVVGRNLAGQPRAGAGR